MSKINNGDNKEEVKEGSKPEQKVLRALSPSGEPKPKRKCSEKQLEALAAGRAKNSRFKPKQK